ncbi:MAG: molybdopterin molybdotransferase MoeA, partial [Polyangia bacterium]|nr:molybdopterin molybdotransferase MoeA [Polyangia bacterium]
MSSPDQAASGVGPQSEGPSLGLLDPDRALELVLERAPGPQAAKRLLQNSFGARILEPILASLPQPSFSRALMDGFAVRIEDAGRKVTCTGEVLAGRTPGPEVEPGKAVAVMTGAPCPRGSEAVVMIEDVERDGERLLLPRVISPGQHLQAAGSLCMPGDVILPAGSIMTSVALAAATAAGVAEITVGRAPAVAIITTGDELSAPDTTLGQAQIFDSNGPMLKALAIATGAEHALLLHAADTVESLTDALAEAANEDIVVLSGGVGVGRRDLVPGVLSALGYDKVFHKVSQQPGMPLFFAVKGEQLAFGQPGTPLGCHLGFHRYVSAA